MTTVTITLCVNGAITATALTGTPPVHAPDGLVLAPDFSGDPLTDTQVNILYGDAIGMGDTSTGGADSLAGGSGFIANDLYGDAASMAGHATGGKDTLLGGAGAASNTLRGDGETLSDSAHGGNDTLTGGIGSAVNDLYGDAYEMLGSARGGKDLLVSSAGTTDRMWGDATFHDPGTTGGKDVFAFASGNGADQIMDFTHGQDRIDLTGFAGTGIHGLGALSISHPGADTLIDFGGGNSILVVGVASLAATDFIFA